MLLSPVEEGGAPFAQTGRGGGGDGGEDGGAGGAGGAGGGGGGGGRGGGGEGGGGDAAGGRRRRGRRGAADPGDGGGEDVGSEDSDFYMAASAAAGAGGGEASRSSGNAYADLAEATANTPPPPTTPSETPPLTPPSNPPARRRQITPSSSGERGGGMAFLSSAAFDCDEYAGSEKDDVGVATGPRFPDSPPAWAAPAVYAALLSGSWPAFREGSSGDPKDPRRRCSYKQRARGGGTYRNPPGDESLPFDKFPLPERLLPLLAESASFWSAVKSGEMELALETLCMLTGLQRPVYRTEPCGSGHYQIALTMKAFQKIYVASAGPASTPLSNLPRQTAAGFALDAMLVPVVGVAWRHEGEKQLSVFAKKRESDAGVDKARTSFASFLSPGESRPRDVGGLERLFAKMNVSGGRTKRAHAGASGDHGGGAGEDDGEFSGRREKREKCYRSPSPRVRDRDPRERLSFAQLAAKYSRPEPPAAADRSGLALAHPLLSQPASAAATGTTGLHDDEDEACGAGSAPGAPSVLSAPPVASVVDSSTSEAT